MRKNVVDLNKSVTPQNKNKITKDQLDSNKGIFLDYDPNFLLQINKSVFKILEFAYFRPEFIGFDDLPSRENNASPLILASNHSGMAFPWDAMVFGCCYHKRVNYNKAQSIRAIVAPQLSGIPPMHPFFMKGSWKLSGGVDASYLNFETMMHHPEGHLLIYPEGVPGIGKGFNKRYQLQRFATSFVKMSLKYKTAIIPFSTVNAEYVVPFVYSFDKINKWFNKIGVPFMAIGIPTLLLIFPWAFYIALPSKMYFVRGKALHPYKWTDKEYDQLDNQEIKSIRDKVHQSMQQDLNEAVELYGKHPYKFSEFLRSCWTNRSWFPYNIPLFWPIIFHEFQRQWIHEKKYQTQEQVEISTGWGSMLRMIFKNPITLAYYLPILGWLILIVYGKIKWRKLDHLGRPIKNQDT